ncbi:hypothetical protein P280DRAFT_474889 [Massarina eburnea CBS 473.64]|uniref:Zn(2)-C6 fungal-type domain-containing protein n=1 Tax=Massarina eburnea CBS 473.64 TaxID=1395130 RepID=A0A6A6RF73_9PLEO|nr:hypothetical protein P280DRAFT_474889 [Massarina eburnea CBS 473.64]
MPAEDIARRRKACQACIRAKAKCSPGTGNNGLCYRCQRLGKECVFDETVKKRGPKSRSRVKQLEQRVDSLIGLLAANGQSVDISDRTRAGYSDPRGTTEEYEVPPATGDATEGLEGTRQQASAPTETPEDQLAATCNNEEFEPYDPVEAGDLSEAITPSLLNEFKESFVAAFPFVVVPSGIDATALRKSQPFLFLCIMTVTSYRTPLTQRALSTQLKRQIAARVIERSHKSLEILQGLLVYGGWYHFFYRPANQQLAIVIQLCVAMVQDLALSKNPRDKGRKLKMTDDLFSTSVTERSSASERAFLGTYYLACGFAQAWRKRATMQHTRYMAQCAERVSSRLEYPSDALVSPLIQLSELSCRVNNFFSLDDIDNADVKGDLMLEMSTANFCAELDRIRDTVPFIIKNNPTFHAKFRLLGICIYECGLHTPLWASPQFKPGTISPIRLRILYRCLEAMKSYVNAVLSTPHSSLHHLGAEPWAAWFYAIVVACKLVFLEENERESLTDIESTDRQVTRLMTDHFDRNVPHAAFPMPAESMAMGEKKTSWDPVSVAKEADLQNLFDRFIDKMKFTVPVDSAAMESENFDPLFCMTCLQLSLSQGFTKRMKEHLSKTSPPNTSIIPNTTSASSYTTPQTGAQATQVPQFPQTEMPTQDSTATQVPNHPIPIMHSFHFNSLNFDSIAMPDPELSVQLGYDDLLWDMVMDDFSMPPL